jgi:low affinity Fe/Cu permease
MNEWFRKAAHQSALVVGSPWAFLAAVVLIVVWAISGPLVGFSDTWQLVINTSTTVLTFLIVFLIQNTQNRESRAMQLKLDELLRAVKEARTTMVALESLPDEELERLQQRFQRLQELAARAESSDERTATRRGEHSSRAPT